MNLFGLFGSRKPKLEGERIARSIRDLGRSNADVRAQAQDALISIGEPAVDDLLQALIAIGEPAVDDLSQVLQSSNLQRRKSIAHVLGRIGDVRALESLIRLLHDRDLAMPQTAASALGDLRGPQAIGPLIDCLNDNRTRGTRAVAHTATQRAAYPALDLLLRVTIISSLSEIGGALILDALAESLTDTEAAYRAAAAEALGKLGDERALEPLTRACGDADASVRDRAANALSALRDERGVLLESQRTILKQQLSQD